MGCIGDNPALSILIAIWKVGAEDGTLFLSEKPRKMVEELINTFYPGVLPQDTELRLGGMNKEDA